MVDDPRHFGREFRPARSTIRSPGFTEPEAIVPA